MFSCFFCFPLIMLHSGFLGKILKFSKKRNKNCLDYSIEIFISYWLCRFRGLAKFSGRPSNEWHFFSVTNDFSRQIASCSSRFNNLTSFLIVSFRIWLCRFRWSAEFSGRPSHEWQFLEESQDQDWHFNQFHRKR